MWLDIGIPAETVEELKDCLDLLTKISERQIRRYNLPHPYVAGIRYQEEPIGREKWQTALETLQLKEGDCEDLAAYLAGWLRAHGTPAEAFLRKSSVGYHCLVQLPDGTVLDPSRQLGMKG